MLTKYDPNDRPISIERRSGAFTQKRLYGWDNRELLLSESHPEVGSSAGPGTVTYSPDALGQSALGLRRPPYP